MFARKASFYEAFPQISNVRVEYSEVGYGAGGIGTDGGRDAIGTETDLSEYIACFNPICNGGGFSIGTLLSEMVSKQQTFREFKASCRGYDGSPKGHRKYRSCLNGWSGKIAIAYDSGDNDG